MFSCWYRYWKFVFQPRTVLCFSLERIYRRPRSISGHDTSMMCQTFRGCPAMNLCEKAYQYRDRRPLHLLFDPYKYVHLMVTNNVVGMSRWRECCYLKPDWDHLVDSIMNHNFKFNRIYHSFFLSTRKALKLKSDLILPKNVRTLGSVYWDSPNPNGNYNGLKQQWTLRL